MNEGTWITTYEAVQLTNYSQEYIRRLIKTGKVNARKAGWHFLVDRASLVAYYDKHNPSPPPLVESSK